MPGHWQRALKDGSIGASSLSIKMRFEQPGISIPVQGCSGWQMLVRRLLHLAFDSSHSHLPSMRVGLHLEVKFLQVTDIYANRRWFQWVTRSEEDRSEERRAGKER